MPVITKNELNEIRAEYDTHFLQIDFEVVTEDSTGCSECGSPQVYEGRRNTSEYRAFAVCTNPECDVVEDF
ncbi:MAG TPA: hypothetical protein VF596_18775 [Pyrinomonadaceae bacterium]|jgi:hypothetical protein